MGRVSARSTYAIPLSLIWTFLYPGFTHYITLSLLVRWNPHSSDLMNLEHSAELHASRLYIVMITHSPMEASSANSKIVPMSDEDISGQAAIKCVEILVTLLRRSPAFSSPNMGQCFITSSLILLTRLWALQKRPYMSADIIMKVKDAYEDTVTGMEEFARRYVMSHTQLLMLAHFVVLLGGHRLLGP